MRPSSHPQRVIALSAVVAALGAAGGCGSSADPGAQVRQTLARFADAVAAHRYGVLCDELLAGDLTTKLARIGLPCERAMARGLAAVRRPRLTVLSVRVQGAHARAEIRTSAANQRPSEDTIELVRSPAGWRISSLGATG